MTITKIFTFMRPSAEATIASNRIASWLSKYINAPLVWDGADIRAEPLPDVLFIVAGPYAYCSALPDLAVAVEYARRIVWVENDYTIIPPKPESGAESPFRKAFRNRHEKGLPTIDYWTTVKSHAEATPLSRYINWNTLAFESVPKSLITLNRAKSTPDLFYYGSFRAGREPYFKKYFSQTYVPVTVSGVGKKFDVFASDNVTVLKWLPRSDLLTSMSLHGLGLYIEDKKSHGQFHSPSGRLYEMLSCGLPMVFDNSCQAMLAKAGFDISPYIVPVPSSLPRLMERREEILERQQSEWVRPYRKLLEESVDAAWRNLTRET